MHRPYLVFSQAPALDLAQLATRAMVHFDAHLEFSSEGAIATVTAFERCQAFTLGMRATTAEDLGRAELAEQRGRAAGMARLAARCPTVVEVASEFPSAPTVTGLSEDPQCLRFALLGALAALLLGPVLPPDDSTLFGTRGARERMRAAWKAEQK